MLRQQLLFLLIAVFLTACNSSGIKKRVIDLDNAINDYNVAMRWAFINKLEDYHRQQDGQKLKVDGAIFEKFKVTGLRITGKTLNDNVDEALISGEIDYYNNEYGTLKKLKIQHTWWYEADSKKWFNGSEFPEFK